MKIAVLGSAPSSCRLAPFDDLSWEIWVCSPANCFLPRVDAWFEMHSLDRKDVKGNEEYMEVLQAHERVYVSKEDSRLPKALVYPKDEILPNFGGRYVQSFMQSSVSYMLAMAITKNPQTIGLWGVDMAAESEYDYQRPGVHFFFNEAAKRNIEIAAPPQSDILEPLPPYGYKEHYPMYWRCKARLKEMGGRLREAEDMIRRGEALKLQLSGAMGDLKYHTNTYLKP